MFRASEAPFSLAATAVLTLAFVAEYIPIKPAVPEHRAPSKNDIGIGENNAKRWLRDGKWAFLPEEIEMWNSIKDLGFVDSWREENPDETSIYSWFDYRSRMFDDDPKRGLRIDHIMVAEKLSESIQSTGIDYDTRSMEKPSDHCPVWIELN